MNTDREPSRTAAALEIVAGLIAAGAAVRVLPAQAIAFDTGLGRAGEPATRAGLVWAAAAGWALLAVAAALVCDTGRRALVSRRRRELAISGLIGACAAAVLAVGSAVLVVDRDAAGGWLGSARAVQFGQAAAFARDCLLAIVLPLALCVFLVLARRLVLSGRSTRSFQGRVIPRRRDGLRPNPAEDPAGTAPAGGASRTTAERKVAGLVHEGVWVPAERTLGGTGICVSGGGIRSACVALGALQALQAHHELQKAEYLVSVSGGGYTAGAYLLARSEETAVLPDDLKQLRTGSGEVFAAGSPEEDHVRRHSSYVADNRAEWATALGTLLRGVLANLALLAATVVALGGLLHLFYRITGLTDVSSLAPRYAPGSGPEAPGVPPLHPGVLIAIGTVLGLSVLAYAVGLSAFSGKLSSAFARHLTRTAKTLATLTLVLAVAGLLLPLLFWGSARLTWDLALGEESVAPAGAGTVLLAYAGALIGILWRSRGRIAKELGTAHSRLGGGPAAMKGVAGGLTQRIVVALTLLMLGAVFLLMLGWTATTAAAWGFRFWVILGVALLAVGVLLDQTWLGLHPFYRRRIASAFAVRRVEKRPGVNRAQRYDYDREPTRLSAYGKRAAGDFPQMIFAGAANLSGSALTPPGRRAASYTMSGDWVGGPQLGWVRTGAVDRGYGHVSRDLTVQGAVAISGAAFASAMGSQAHAYQTFFALTNARLGTWLPNPGYLADHFSDPAPSWHVPEPPHKRRLQYLMREIAGSYPDDNPLLFVTDGGHYENLGLVELLRHRSTFVYCIDASGDAPPLAATLAHAITLAYEELGVRIVLDHPYDLVAGSAGPLQPKEPLAGLSGRLSSSCVLTGTIHYPKVKDLPASTGKLVVAKASLTPDMPYEVLSYAQSNPVFPHDSTADQWFDVGQFDAYQAVGRHIGTAAVEARRALTPPLRISALVGLLQRATVARRGRRLQG